MAAKRTQHRRRHIQSPYMELAVVLGVVLLIVSAGVFVATTNRPSPNTPSLGAIAFVATATTTVGATSVTGTPVIDPGVATYIAELTATPVSVAPKPTGTPILPTLEPEPTLVAGINNEYPVGPFSPQEFRAINVWKGPTAAGWMMVFAGARKDPGESGSESPAVRVYAIATDAANRPVPGGIALLGDFDAPGVTGAVQIVAVSEAVLELETTAGDELTFDVVALEYGP